MKDSIIIGFDAKRIVRNNTGLGNYCRTLINDMIRCNNGDKKLLLYTPDKGRDELRNQIIESNNSEFIFPKKNLGKIYKSLWRTKNIVKQLLDDKVQIYHGLSGELPVGLRENGIKSVVTIHDLIFLRHPQYYHWIDRKIYTWKFHQAIKHADRIIAISECTKRDILEFGKTDPEKISVIYQSCNPKFTDTPSKSSIDSTTEKYKLPKRYLLCVGTIEERKNLMLAMESLKFLPEDIHLVAVGRQTKYAEKVKINAEKSGVSHRLHLLSGVNDDELNVIYKKAEIFVYPSRYEGFGIPIIEAIFCGLPVVACTGSCLEEAGGPDCHYVNPDDTKGMADAITQLLNNEEDRARRVASSMEYIQKYQGVNIASQIFNLYQSL